MSVWEKEESVKEKGEKYGKNNLKPLPIKIWRKKYGEYFLLRKFHERTDLFKISNPLVLGNRFSWDQESLKVAYLIFIKLQQPYFEKVSPKVILKLFLIGTTSHLTKTNLTHLFLMHPFSNPLKTSEESFSVLNKSGLVKKKICCCNCNVFIRKLKNKYDKNWTDENRSN